MNQLNSSCYAYPAARKLQINTKEAAEDSISAYRASRHLYPAAMRPKIEENLKKAAAFHGIPLENGQNKEAGAENDPILLRGGRKMVEMVKLEDESQVQAAADWIIDKRASELREDLEESAKYVILAANELGVDLSDEKMKKVARIGGLGVGDSEKMEKEVLKRFKMHILNDSERSELSKMASELRNCPDGCVEPEKMIKVCNYLDEMDSRHHGMHLHQGPDGYPEDAIFESTLDDLLKEAADLGYLEKSDITVSRSVLEAEREPISGYLKAHFSEIGDLEGENLLRKLGSLDYDTLMGVFAGAGVDCEEA